MFIIIRVVTPDLYLGSKSIFDSFITRAQKKIQVHKKAASWREGVWRSEFENTLLGIPFDNKFISENFSCLAHEPPKLIESSTILILKELLVTILVSNLYKLTENCRGKAPLFRKTFLATST